MSVTTTETLDVNNLICGLKAAVTALECQHKMELEKKQMLEQKHQKPTCAPMYMMIPVQKNNSDSNTKYKQKFETKSSTSCISKQKEKNKGNNRTKKRKNDDEDECAFISPEMRGGVLYSRCNCLYRNGLQDDCPLSLCQGQPDCLVTSWPECPPGKYYRARHPDIYTSPPNSNG